MRSLYYFLFIFLIFFLHRFLCFLYFFLTFPLLWHSLSASLSHFSLFSLLLSCFSFSFPYIYIFFYFLTCCFPTPTPLHSRPQRRPVGFACLKCHALFKRKLSVVLFTNIVFLSFAYLSAAVDYLCFFPFLYFSLFPGILLWHSQKTNSLKKLRIYSSASRHCGIR